MRVILEGVDDTMTQSTNHEKREAWVTGHYSATFRYSGIIINSVG